MFQKLHKNARTTFSIRKEIQESKEKINVLANRYGLTWKTVKKWKTRKGIEDKSSKPNKLRLTLSQYEEDLILFERKKFKKTIDEIYCSLKDRINNLYPVKIYRLLKRYNLSVLPEELVKAERKIKKFKNYSIGYLHLDTMYVPKINKKRWYIFTAIDRVSKLAYVWVMWKKSRYQGRMFLNNVIDFYPYKLNYILTDNGGEFSYNFINPIRRPKIRLHPFDALCKRHNIQHRTIKFKHPWTNGMVERFNGKIRSKVLKRHLFISIDDLKEKLIEYINDYNTNIKLKQLNYKSPAEYLKVNYNYSIQPIVT